MLKKLKQYFCPHNHVKLIGRIERNMTEFSDSAGKKFLSNMVDSIECLSCGKVIIMEWFDHDIE